MFIRNNLPGIFWAVLTLLLCGIPGGEVPETILFEHIDKLIHAFLFATLVLLLIVGFIKQYTFKLLRYNAAYSALISGVFYGVLIELFQGAFFVERSMELMDILANIIGSTFGVICFYLIYGTKPYR